MKKRLLRFSAFATGAALCCAGLIFTFHELLPRLADDPLEIMKKETPVRIYYDRYGNELYFERTYDAVWRFPVPLNAVPPRLIRVILAAEDIRFFEHDGLDYQSIFRAAWQNLKNGRIVSGASTISMQLAGMSDPDRSRTLSRKLRQILRARRMEQLHTKEEILSEYLNRLPFGGKIHGIEAAARYYYGIHTKDLTLAETALLCGIPQKPNAFRPDRHPEEARRRQMTVLRILEHHGVIPPDSAERYGRERIRLRDTKQEADFQRLSHADESMFFLKHARREAGDAMVIRTSLDPEKQKLVLETLRSRRTALPAGTDAACVLLDNHTGEVLACVGSADIHAPDGGQVDATLAVRTAGSVLKPFLYREAVRAGRLTAATVLSDTPLRYANYMPGNASGEYMGNVRAGIALTHSLNTPAVRLLAMLTPLRMAREMEKIGLLSDAKKKAQENGLAMALGTAGHSLLSIVQAYTVFTGPLLTPTFLHKETAPQERTPDPASALISHILSSEPLPHATVAAAWKTGTSSGSRDAWCAAYTADWTVCVWIGRKDGAPVPGLSGHDHAAPCAGAILQKIGGEKAETGLPDRADPRFFTRIKLCAKSGLRASGTCPETNEDICAAGIPLRLCTECTESAKKTPSFRILFPKPGVYQTGPDGVVHLRLQASIPDVLYFTDETFLGASDPEERHAFGPGRHRVTAVCPSLPDTVPATVEFTVEKPPER